MFAPLPELATLHDPSDGGHVLQNVTLVPSPQPSNFTMLRALDPTTALHHHMQITADFSTAIDASLVVCVECDENGGGGVTATMQITVVDNKPSFTCMLGNGASKALGISDAALAKGSVAAVLDVFTDGAVVELFANNGEQVGEQGRPSVSNAGVGFAAGGKAAEVNFSVELWRMRPSVE